MRFEKHKQSTKINKIFKGVFGMRSPNLSLRLSPIYSHAAADHQKCTADHDAANHQKRTTVAGLFLPPPPEANSFHHEYNSTGLYFWAKEEVQI
ncbi:hypothetical protein L484_006773 [Morus notabilis]|uniref:Uncharacterized protein n=1 Tax=Morus notabilis TaxID=981085 RepID=W9QTJ8_9ROSA|nr:hypothetical protein L484_006773 [Morus notabilis]